MIRRFALVFAGALLLGGCDQDSIADKVVFDLGKHVFTADRHFATDLGGEHVDYVERVHSDGQHLLVELLSLNGQSRTQITDPKLLSWFDRLNVALHEGGGDRALFQRDPAVDDIDRLLANYDVIPLQLGRMDIRTGGEPTLTVRLEPRVHDRSMYVLTVSTAAAREGFPLAAQEFVYDSNGPRLVSEMEVTRLDYGDSEGQVRDRATPILSRTPLTGVTDAATRANALGVTLLLPATGSLPSGFDLVDVELVEYQVGSSAQQPPQLLKLFRFVYSDGVEHIDFVEHLPLTGSGGRIGDPGTRQDVAAITRFGPISIASLFHRGTQIVIESRLANDRFGALLQSLVKV